MASASATLMYLLSHLILLLILCSSHEYDSKTCPSSFDCGSLGTLGYPFTTIFYPNCGIFVINCTFSPQTIGISPKGPWYEVMDSFPSNHTFLLGDEFLENALDSCDNFRNNTFSLPTSSAVTYTALYNETFWKCHKGFNRSGNFRRVLACQDYNIYYTNYSGDSSSSLSNCKEFLYPRFLILDLSTQCSQCKTEGGNCQELNNGVFQCISKRKEKRNLPLTLGLAGSALCGAIALIAGIIIYTKRRKTTKRLTNMWDKEATRNQNVEAFLKNYGSLAPKSYTSAEIKKMTNNFSKKLGEGGFGAVYKGQLQDSRFVAVKKLKELKGDGDDFLNEVVSISKTNHVNIVSLLGFCFEGNKRALVYEFMPNGSLERFIDKEARGEPLLLPSQTLFGIVLGIAKGLDYLHRGCNMRILHFDIKPHNVLLDEQLCPKISDFGLARLCPAAKYSSLSMIGARGTIGYIAPEVFCRNFGGISHKSDVYSYGMMLLDMVCGRKNVVVGSQKSSETYFPDWIYHQLELQEESEIHEIMNNEESELKRKMILVGLWCIQTYPSNRPAINRAIEMLEGPLDLLQVPPKPLLSSPPHTVLDSLVTQSVFNVGY